jgi:hypothetical protein
VADLLILAITSETDQSVGVKSVSKSDERRQFKDFWRERMENAKDKRVIQLRNEVIEMEFDIAQMVAELVDDNWESRDMKKRLEEMKNSRELIYAELDLVSPVEVE